MCVIRYRIAEPGTDDIATYHRIRTTRSAMVSVIENQDEPGFAAFFRKPFDWTFSSSDLNPVG